MISGNKFFKKAELLKHEKIHTGNTSYNCEICGKMAVNKQSLDTHLLSHTNEVILVYLLYFISFTYHLFILDSIQM